MNRDADTPHFAPPLAEDAPDRPRLLLVDLSSLRLAADMLAADYGLAAADRNLYLAKTAGHNRVMPANRGGARPSSYSDPPASGGFYPALSLQSRDP